MSVNRAFVPQPHISQPNMPQVHNDRIIPVTEQKIAELQIAFAALETTKTSFDTCLVAFNRNGSPMSTLSLFDSNLKNLNQQIENIKSIINGIFSTEHHSSSAGNRAAVPNPQIQNFRTDRIIYVRSQNFETLQQALAAIESIKARLKDCNTCLNERSRAMPVNRILNQDNLKLRDFSQEIEKIKSVMQAIYPAENRPLPNNFQPVFVPPSESRSIDQRNAQEREARNREVRNRNVPPEWSSVFNNGQVRELAGRRQDR